MPKDKKAKAAEKKARVAQKQAHKSAKKDKKASGRTKREKDDGDESDVDLEAVLAEYAAAQDKFLRVEEVVCDPPSARASATLIASPASERELFLFGGEYYNGALARFFNDLYCYNIHRDEWRRISSPNSPLPRSGHAWCRGGNAGGVYLFGGEFSSPKQGTFYHYNDFWRLDPATREWTKIETKGKGPPARSGHRMTYFKQYIILFGGFQDTSSQTKYLQDVWLYDTQDFLWHNPTPQGAQKPEARSSFTLLPHEGGAVLTGGYSRVKSTVQTRTVKGSSGAARTAVMKPMVHLDSWFLRIIPPATDEPPTKGPTVRWERRKKPTNAPNPPRAGATMAFHRGRGIQFGGVHDVENSEEGIESEFFNTLFVWNTGYNRYFPLNLRRPRAGQQKRAAPNQNERARRGRGKADEEELLKNLASIEKRGGIQEDEDAADEVTKAEEDDDDEPALPEKTVLWEMPHPRFNAQLAVQGDALYIYGGTFEKGDQEFTFDEMWAVDLSKLDGVKEIFKRNLEDWQGSEDEEDEEEEEDDDDDEDKDENEEEDEEGNRSDAETKSVTDRASKVTADSEVSTPLTPMTELSIADPTERSEIDEDPDEQRPQSNLPHPRPFESLRAFYARTAGTWLEILWQLSQIPTSGVSASLSEKELRKLGFARSEERWWDCREEVLQEEDALEEAGVGEVVNIDRGRDAEAAGGGGARRR